MLNVGQQSYLPLFRVRGLDVPTSRHLTSEEVPRPVLLSSLSLPWTDIAKTIPVSCVNVWGVGMRMIPAYIYFVQDERSIGME